MQIGQPPEDAESVLDGSGLRPPRNILRRCDGDVLHGPKVVERRASVNTACGQPDPSGVEARPRHPRGDGAAGSDASDEAGGCPFASAAGAESGEVAEDIGQRLLRRFDDGGEK